MNEPGRSCPWCRSGGAPLNGCNHIWHEENLADLQEARRVPIHEKVFATAGNVDTHEWTSADSAIADLAQDVRELTEVNEGLRLQIEHLNAELATAHSDAVDSLQLLGEVRVSLRGYTDRYDWGHDIANAAESVLALWPKEGN